MSLLNDCAFQNMPFMLVTLDTSNFDMSPYLHVHIYTPGNSLKVRPSPQVTTAACAPRVDVFAKESHWDRVLLAWNAEEGFDCVRCAAPQSIFFSQPCAVRSVSLCGSGKTSTGYISGSSLATPRSSVRAHETPLQFRHASYSNHSCPGCTPASRRPGRS